MHIKIIQRWCSGGAYNLLQNYDGYTRWPRKNATLTRNNFKKMRDRKKKLRALWCKQFFFPSKMTPRLLSLIKAFWFYGRFSEAMTFWRFNLSQKWQFKFAIIWLPSKKCLLLFCKAKPASIQKSIHYITWKHYNLGELLKEFPHYFKRDFWYKRSKFPKWHCLTKIALESKRLHQNH